MFATVHTLGKITDEFQVKSLEQLLNILKSRDVKTLRGLNQIEKSLSLKLNEDMHIRVKCASFDEASMALRRLRVEFGVDV